MNIRSCTVFDSCFWPVQTWNCILHSSTRSTCLLWSEMCTSNLSISIIKYWNPLLTENYSCLKYWTNTVIVDIVNVCCDVWGNCIHLLIFHRLLQGIVLWSELKFHEVSLLLYQKHYRGILSLCSTLTLTSLQVSA